MRVLSAKMAVRARAALMANKFGGEEISVPGQGSALSERVFKKYDADGSGAIDPHEFSDMVAELGHALTPAQKGAAIMLLDRNADGIIQLEEFKRWWAKPEPDPSSDV